MFGREQREQIREALQLSRAALDKATTVESHITNHEKLCGERWVEAKDSMGEVQDWQKRVMWGIVTILFLVLGKILMDSIHFQVHLGAIS